MTESGTVDELAFDLLIDIGATFPYGAPKKERPRFQFLQPEYSRAGGEDVLDRIVEAFRAVPLGARRDRLYDAVAEAMSRCVSKWFGVTTTLAVAELALRIVPESISSDTWRRMLQRTDVPPVAATWPERLIRLLAGFRVQIDAVDQLNWVGLIDKSSIAALPDVAEWTLVQLRAEPQPSIAVRRATFFRIGREREALARTWQEVDKVEDRLDAEFLSGLPIDEKLRWLNHAKMSSEFPEPSDKEIDERHKNELVASIRDKIPGFDFEPDAIADEVALTRTVPTDDGRAS